MGGADDHGRKRRRRRIGEEGALEVALAAAATAIFLSGLGKLLPLALSLLAPPPFLLLLLNLVIAAVVASSVSIPPDRQCRGTEKRKNNRKKRWGSAEEGSLAVSVNGDGLTPEEEEGGGDAAEVNARAEAFIAAFRRQLRLDLSRVKAEVPAPRNCLYDESKLCN